MHLDSATPFDVQSWGRGVAVNNRKASRTNAVLAKLIKLISPAGLALLHAVYAKSGKPTNAHAIETRRLVFRLQNYWI